MAAEGDLPPCVEAAEGRYVYIGVGEPANEAEAWSYTKIKNLKFVGEC